MLLAFDFDLNLELNGWPVRFISSQTWNLALFTSIYHHWFIGVESTTSNGLAVSQLRRWSCSKVYVKFT